MSWSCIQGDTLKTMPLQVIDGGVPFPLEEGDEVLLRYADPDGTVFEKELAIIDGPTGQLEAQWDAGETDIAGPYQGQIKITRIGEPVTFPDDGLSIVWNVYKAIGA